MSRYGFEALEELWTSFVVVFALVIGAMGVAVLASIWPAEAVPAEDIAPSDPKWTALWGLIVVVWISWMVRKFIWRPYWQWQKVALPQRDKRLILGMLALTAVPQAFILGLWIVPIAWIDTSGWVVLICLPLFWYWEWLQKRVTPYVEWAIALAGFDYCVEGDAKVS